MPARPAIAFDWLNGDILELRARYEQAFAVADSETCRRDSITLEGRTLRLLIHNPPQTQSGGTCIVYFHGGGWIVGSPATHADISRALSEVTKLRVISVDYRLAPEHPAPAPIEDGAIVLSHLLSQSNAADVVLCGDSAGAAIALAVERRTDSATRARIRGVCSLYGCFGLLDSPTLIQWGKRADGLDADCVRRMWTLANRQGGISPYAIASLAGDSSVPVYLLAAGRDPLRYDTLALVRAFEASKRSLLVDLIEPESHGFLHASESESAAAALRRIAAWINSLTVAR